MKLYKYTFKSPLRGSIQCEELFSDTDGIEELDSEDLAQLCTADSQLSEFLENNREDLTEYIDTHLKTDVRKMEVGDYGLMEGKLYLMSHVWVEEELTEAGMREVMDYLSGQFSDGWGEGLEQCHWRRDRVRYSTPHFDTYSGEWEDEEHDTEAYFYVQAWHHSGFTIELHDCETEEVADPKPVIHSAICRLQENGGYTTRSILQFNTVQETIQLVRNSGAYFSEEFLRWMENFGTFGRDVRYYLIHVTEGLIAQFKYMLGTLDADTQRARLFIMDAEDGSVYMEEYMEEEHMDFFNDLLIK